MLELLGCMVVAFVTVWLAFSLAHLSAAFGALVCGLLLFFVLYWAESRALHGALTAKDRIGAAVVWSASGLAAMALVGVIAWVILKGAPIALSHFPDFLTRDMTQGNPLTGNGYGVGQAIVGTMEQVAIAAIISVPLAFLTATYLVESNSLLSCAVRIVIDAMTGTPSIIAGLFVFLIWVDPHKTLPSAKNGTVAGVTLAVMMLPIVTRASLEVIRIVPGSLREAALSLGAPRWRVALRVVLPTARVGLITASILGVARTAGETAEVLFTAGGSEKFNWNPFASPQDDLPLRVFEQVFEPNAGAVRVGWGAAFVLVCLVLAIFTTARLIGSSGGRGTRRHILRRRVGPKTEKAADLGTQDDGVATPSDAWQFPSSRRQTSP